jgi:hypothetical protein
MLRIGLLVVFITGIYFFVRVIRKQQNPAFVYFRINPIKAAHDNHDKIINNEEYYLSLKFDHHLVIHKKRFPLSKPKATILKCSNQISDIKIFSTEKMNEMHPAGKDISGIFDFHYIRNLQTKYGTMIKEGVIIPLSEFENIVDQDNAANQLKELKLRLSQKPVMKSEHQFIINIFFENGEIWSDTTGCISFEGVTP